MTELTLVVAFLAQVVRIGVPYFFAAAGGVLSERVGVIALSLEGYMLTGAFCTALGAYYSGSPWVGMLCGLAVNAIVPKEMVDVLQAVVILAIVMSVPEVRRLLRARVRNGERA